ncbi:MAG TPA: BtpA/SgcQ family protein [Thermoanaerobaculia bacterium]|nr:BtpA/SgcQ family protein [Thermoanaerobaculia bacterium]
MLTRSTFATQFGNHAVFGMIHLLPLPGSPLFRGSMQEVIDAALRDAAAIVKGDANGLMVENFGDVPFTKGPVEAETIAAMTVAIVAIRSETSLPIGVNVLRADSIAALGIAVATGARLIRVNVLTGAMLTDQGIIESNAYDLMRKRSALRGDVAVLGDVLVKHAHPLVATDIQQEAKDLRERALADAIVISGKETGAEPDAERFCSIRSVLADVPLIVGSGLTISNARRFSTLADAAIVGSAIKLNGVVSNGVDSERVARLVEAFKPGS